ncbi:hypothetical protein [Williamsia muralis]|uniref:Tetratricopeptide repeat protein n=1 Tax=Williamsia marianensis TaxID=85044 RepID=A0A2G3PIN0_WILMA|nr:hypothetical protein [Williamsia marianensis]PHV65603.1 hypothetical protein CSW57_17825 [Williamsia marianensis]
MSVAGDLERARDLACADDHAAARDLLLSLMPKIEQLDRDDLMLEVFAQLGAIYLTRSAHDGVVECIRRIRDCVGVYSEILAGKMPEAEAQVTMSSDDITRMVHRYTGHADVLDIGLASARGDHDEAARRLAHLSGNAVGDPDSDPDQRFHVTHARILTAIALGDVDEHMAAAPLWELGLEELHTLRRSVSEPGPPSPSDAWSGPGPVDVDRLQVDAGIGYGRFCVLTGRLDEAGSQLRRAGALASQRDWPLASARSELERAALAWARSDHADTERLAQAAYPVLATYAVADDVSRCWLYLGLTRMAAGELQAADHCWEQAQRHWDELGIPLHRHRILMQRSWIPVFCGQFDRAREMVGQARMLLDATPQATWLHHARLDDLTGSIWRAEALADMGFDGIGDPLADWSSVEARVAMSEGITTATDGTAGHLSAQPKFERAAALKIPAALAVDSVRHSMPDAEARSRWARSVSAPVMAGAFAVAWEWDNTSLVAEMIEYVSARGTFGLDPSVSDAVGSEWALTATGATPVHSVADIDENRAVAAGATTTAVTGGLTRLGPLPPLQMDRGGGAILAEYRRLAAERYGREVTSDEPMWPTWR